MGRRKELQLGIPFRTHGGKRKHAGRKPKGERAGVSHLRREQLGRLLPVHVTMRMARHVYNLRSRRAFAVVGRAIARAAERFDVSIVRFSVQGNHVHLVVEAGSAEALSRAMQGFSIRVAKGLNRMMKREGRVMADRFHARALRTPSEVRRAITYVRRNYAKHMAEIGQVVPRGYVDPYASEGAGIALPRARSWLARTGAPP